MTPSETKSCISTAYKASLQNAKVLCHASYSQIEDRTIQDLCVYYANGLSLLVREQPIATGKVNPDATLSLSRPVDGSQKVFLLLATTNLFMHYGQLNEAKNGRSLAELKSRWHKQCESFEGKQMDMSEAQSFCLLLKLQEKTGIRAMHHPTLLPKTLENV